MSSHDEANDASTLSVPDRVFISTGCFSLDISGRRLSSLKNAEWGGGEAVGGNGGLNSHVRTLRLYLLFVFFPPRFTCFFFFFHAWLPSHSVRHWCWQDSPHHLYTLHFTSFFRLIYLRFCCLLPLFPASPLWPLLQQPWRGRWERNQLKSMRGVD